MNRKIKGSILGLAYADALGAGYEFFNGTIGEDEEIDFTTLFDLLSYYYEHPINLNKKDISYDLEQLRILDQFQINAIVEHIETGSLMFCPGSQISDKPIKNIDHLKPENSVIQPATSSDSASGMSNGVLFVSARALIKKMIKAIGIKGLSKIIQLNIPPD